MDLERLQLAFGTATRDDQPPLLSNATILSTPSIRMRTNRSTQRKGGTITFSMDTDRAPGAEYVSDEFCVVPPLFYRLLSCTYFLI